MYQLTKLLIEFSDLYVLARCATSLTAGEYIESEINFEMKSATGMLADGITSSWRIGADKGGWIMADGAAAADALMERIGDMWHENQHFNVTLLVEEWIGTEPSREMERLRRLSDRKRTRYITMVPNDWTDKRPFVDIMVVREPKVKGERVTRYREYAKRDSLTVEHRQQWAARRFERMVS